MRRSIVPMAMFLVLLAVNQKAIAEITIRLDSVSSEPLPLVLLPIEVKRGEAAAALKLRIYINDYLQLADHFRVIESDALLKDVSQEGFGVAEIDFNHYRLLAASLLVKGFCRIRSGRLRGRLYAYDVAARKRVLEYKLDVKAPQLQQAAKDFVDQLLLLLTGERGIFDTRIAFISNRTGKKELYVINFDGTHVSQLTDFKNIVLSPNWSPNGENLVFVAYPKYGRRGKPQLYISNPDSKQIKALPRVNSNVIAPVWHPSSNHLLLTLSPRGDPEIYLFPLKRGKKLRRLTHSYGIDVSPAVGPGGAEMVFASDRSGSGRPQLYIQSLVRRSRARRITFEGKHNTSPDWSQRGNRIVYSGMTADGRINLFVTKPDGKESMQLTFGAGNNEHPSWSPDGRRLVFASNRDGRYHLYSMRADGSQLKQLTWGNYDDTMPVWSARRHGIEVVSRRD